MGRITEDLIRRRAEHNEYMLSTLEELALHQQHIRKIEQIGNLCPKLKILYLQNNIICKIQNLHKLKDLQYLNLAVNNITKIQNLQRCESLQKLDLTINFIPTAGLLSISSLAGNYNLRELFLLGNPCTDWPGYRQYVVSKLPQLFKLVMKLLQDGQLIKASERIAAGQALHHLDQQLHVELSAQGVDVAAAASAEDDGDIAEQQDVAETGFVDEQGELRRPWCPATRILEHREMEKANHEAEAARAASQKDPFASPSPPPRLEDFPPLPDVGQVLQRNEGKWDFTLDESDDRGSLVLEVAVGKYLDTSLIKADVQPHVVRLLIKGRLLQLVLPAEVKPDSSEAQRSSATGRLVLTMPKEDPECHVLNVTLLRPKDAQAKAVIAFVAEPVVATPKGAIAASVARQQGVTASNHCIRGVCKATVYAAAEDDLPDL